MTRKENNQEHVQTRQKSQQSTRATPSAQTIQSTKSQLDTTIYHIKNGCPLCGSDVKGNALQKFYCTSCNLLFNRNQLKLEPLELYPKRKTSSNLDNIHQKNTQTPQHTMEQNAPSKPTKPHPFQLNPFPASATSSTHNEETSTTTDEYALESKNQLIASDKSIKMHHGQCHFVAKIHKHNRIYLTSIEDGKQQGYESCVCLRRRGK